MGIYAEGIPWCKSMPNNSQKVEKGLTDKCHDIADPGLTVKSFTTSLTHVKYHSFRIGN
jgi:hypothetical protein